MVAETSQNPPAQEETVTSAAERFRSGRTQPNMISQNSEGALENSFDITEYSQHSIEVPSNPEACLCTGDLACG